MNIKFVKEKYLKIIYSPENGTMWIRKNITDGKELRIKNTFVFEPDDVINIDEDGVVFKLAILEKEYYKIDKRILESTADVYIEKTLDFKMEYFKYKHNNWFTISVFSKISEIMNKKKLYVGGSSSDISIEEFKELIKRFPNAYERELYSRKQIEMLLEDYFDISSQHQIKYNNYMNKKSFDKKTYLFPQEFYENELFKYKYVLEKLKEMLNNSSKYSEAEWQNEISEIILILFPKYIKVYREVRIPLKNYYKKYEKIDFTLLTWDGNIDILEIKKPNNNLISSSMDRGNHYPKYPLSKCVMQTENYLYHINRLGLDADKIIEAEMNKKNHIPNNIHLKIINPRALILMGVEEEYSFKQKEDLELIKRHYANIMEIITYDDLIRRMENIVSRLEQEGE